MKSLTGPILKSLVFIVVTVVATTLLALTITNGSLDTKDHYAAVFTDAASVNPGDDVRMAGVRVGQVSDVQITGRTKAKVSFSLEDGVVLARTVTATIRYRNLIGQRYLALDEGDGALTNPLPSGSTITDTTPALDLTVLFNGFQPLFQALSPREVNTLSASIIQVFQGEGPTIDNLLAQTSSLTNTLADKDKVIGDVVTNLSSVLQVVSARGSQLSTLISTLATFVHGFAQDRATLGHALDGLSGLTTDVGSLLQQGRAPLKASITSLGRLSANLAGSSGALNSFLQTLPGKLTTVGRLASYGSWLNFFECSIDPSTIPVPTDNGRSNGTPVYGNVPTTQYPAPPGVAAYPTVAVGPPDPTGLVGANPVAPRCHA